MITVPRAATTHQARADRMDDKAHTDLRAVGVCLLVAVGYVVLGSDWVHYVTAAAWLLCAGVFVLSYRWHRRAAAAYRSAAALVVERSTEPGDT